MENSYSFEALLHFAALELENTEYREYLEKAEQNQLPMPDRSFTDKIVATVNRGKKSEQHFIVRKRLSKILMLFFVFFTMISMPYLSVDAVRETVAKVTLQWFEQFTIISLENENIPDKLPQFELGYIPPLFENRPETFYLGDTVIYVFNTDNSHMLRVFISVVKEGISFHMDNENFEYYDIKIDNIPALWTSDGENNFLILSQNGITYSISGEVSLNELIKVYKNIKIV